ncbi:UxaA family hydrolase [Paenibacillus tarimensis]|uniref:UxaA family hydrolase n=1 Tax=Paenibacillus tarimensis TaxID=416012 RepID=UPI001F410045|nr:altronate dehydratase family protein [Paenibacillus tarimensis]MCF2944862.1 altronate dehydratase family protein [Paenibacillus tarimensis]
MSRWIRLHEQDHVVIALEEIPAGARLKGITPGGENGGEWLTAADTIPKGHKILTRRVRAGEHIHKFGYSIGVAKQDIEPGTWVHTHNLASGLKGILDYSYEPDQDQTGRPAAETAAGVSAEAAAGPADKPAGLAADDALPVKNVPASQTFKGYVRSNGEVGIRNEIWIINTVGCINKTCEILARRGSTIFEGRVDGIYHFAHPFGCSQLGDDLTYTQKLLASLVNHPNAAGVLVVGLGCENNQIDAFKSVIGNADPKRVKFMKSQDEEDELEAGLELLEELVVYAERFQREPVPVSKLKLGLKCGGSDGLSGITANPLVGAVSDKLIAAGGTAILTEVPEMFGAETILMNRAADEQVFSRIVSLVNDFKQYFIRHGQEVYENPSPGNKAGGISTLEEKSLGCTQKGGHATVTDVLPYGGRASLPGLTLLEAPGNDLVSVTALSAAGAHIVLFTTGRGTPFGGPVPTVKISTNSELAARKRNWIDFNAGRLLEGVSMESLTDSLWAYLISLASGEVQTHNEANGFKEIAIFKDGVIL